VVIPARDEVPTIGGLVAEVLRILDCEVLVVSDASEDGTAAAARAAGAQVLDLPAQIGAWGATQCGIRFALRRGFDTVLTLDGDGQHDPACLPDLLAALDDDGADIVVGTFPERLSAAKRLAWAWFRALTGLKVEDLTSGMRVYRGSALRVLAGADATLLDYQDVGVLLLLRRHGLRLREVPVVMMPRRCGHSRVFASWAMVAQYMAKTTLLCIARVGRRRPLRVGGLGLEEV
jgi:glycosyltransferase involved in cell wall biosynthesis